MRYGSRHPVVVLAVVGTTRAPRPVSSRARPNQSSRLASSSRQSTQAQPRNSSGSVAAKPAVSRPAIGWPPT